MPTLRSQASLNDPQFSEIALNSGWFALTGFPLSRLGVTADVGEYEMFCTTAHEVCCKIGAEQQVQSDDY